MEDSEHLSHIIDAGNGDGLDTRTNRTRADCFEQKGWVRKVLRVERPQLVPTAKNWRGYRRIRRAREEAGSHLQRYAILNLHNLKRCRAPIETGGTCWGRERFLV